MASPGVGDSDFMGRMAVFMLESFPVILFVGILLGFLSGIGIGGGSLLILWLTMVLGMEQQIARSINLLFFIPSAVIACLFRWKQGCLDIKKIIPAALAGCISAGVFSLLGSSLHTEVLKKLFGMLLITTGTRELLWKGKTQG